MKHTGSAIGVALAESSSTELVPAPWATALVDLGARLARRAAALEDDQLVVALTVPVRDFAALLLATGWTLTRPTEIPGPPDEIAERLPRGTPVRMVTDQIVIANRFFGMQDATGGRRLHVGNTHWEIEKVRHLSAAPELTDGRFGRRDVTIPGSLTQKAGQATTWLARQCAPSTCVSIIGTRSWLEAELQAWVGWGTDDVPDRFTDILLPDLGNPPSWATTLYPAQAMQELELPGGPDLVVLDGSSAIHW
ncbi:MAG: hypothetical protein ACREYC_19215, partial [Gammaproteobacteria bacterium]